MRLTLKSLRGMQVCVTGGGRYVRSELVAQLKRHHAVPVTRVTSATNILVQGYGTYRTSRDGVKSDEARRLIAEGSPLIVLAIGELERLLDGAPSVRADAPAANRTSKPQKAPVTGNSQENKTKRRPPPHLPVKREALDVLLHELPAAERRTRRREIEAVIRDAAMRRMVLGVWGTACAACGVALVVGTDVECEIAHVHEVRHGGPDQAGNGIPLCRTHHWAFDRQLWGIEPTTLAIRVAKSASRELNAINGRKIRRPRNVGAIAPLDAQYVGQRWAHFLECVGGRKALVQLYARRR